MADPILAISGIYAIRHVVSGRVYIGSAINLRRRLIVHKCRLTHNVHPSLYLQRAWNKHGGITFSFEIIEVVTAVSRLLEREQHWIDTFASYEKRNGFNARRIATSNLGLSPTAEAREKQRLKLAIYWAVPGRREAEAIKVTGRKMTPEAIEKSASKRRGRKLPEAHKANLSKAHSGVPLSAGHRAAIGKGALGKKRGAGFRAAVSAGIKLHWVSRHAAMTDEDRARKAARIPKGAFSVEHRAKISAALKGKPKTPGHVARFTAARMANAAARRHQLSAACASIQAP